jgi:hypothetical protein
MTMSNRTELSRGDARRNDRRRLLREIVSRDRAICGIDLADEVQEPFLGMVPNFGIIQCPDETFCSSSVRRRRPIAMS